MEIKLKGKDWFAIFQTVDDSLIFLSKKFKFDIEIDGEKVYLSKQFREGLGVDQYSRQ